LQESHRATDVHNVDRIVLVLEAITKLVATDPRDSVYSLLGILDLPILPDYKKSMEQAYVEFVELAGNKLPHQILRFAGYSGSDSLFPSWVPNWRLADQNFSGRYDSRYLEFDARGCSTDERIPVLRMSFHDGVLTTKGVYCDERVLIDTIPDMLFPTFKASWSDLQIHQGERTRWQLLQHRNTLPSGNS
jgi:hypothetical protein